MVITVGLVCTKSGRANQKAQMSFPSAITRLTQSVKSADSSDEQQNQAIKLTLRGQSYRSRENRLFIPIPTQSGTCPPTFPRAFRRGPRRLAWGARQPHGYAVAPVVALQAQGLATQGRSLSTPAPLRALRPPTT